MTYIEALRAIGDVQPIDREVDWNLEIGAVIRRSYDLTAPAPLFNRIKGYEASEFRVLGAPAALSSRRDMPLARLALGLGLAPQATGQEIVEAIVAAHDREPIPHRIVDRASAPCKQNVATGDDVDVLAFPATAEIVIEGHIGIADDDVAVEGPMNEYPGYIATEASPKPVFHISAITWRDQAILPVVAAGPPVEEDHTKQSRTAR